MDEKHPPIEDRTEGTADAHVEWFDVMRLWFGDEEDPTL